jgi:hypothetical protein
MCTASRPKDERRVKLEIRSAGLAVHPEVVGDGSRRLRRFTFTWLKALAIPPHRLPVTLKRTEVRAPSMAHNFGMHRGLDFGLGANDPDVKISVNSYPYRKPKP